MATIMQGNASPEDNRQYVDEGIIDLEAYANGVPDPLMLRALGEIASRPFNIGNA